MVNRQLQLNTLFLVLFLTAANTVSAQKLGFKKLLMEYPNTATTFCVPNTPDNVESLNSAKKSIKYKNSQWLFITSSPKWIDESVKSGEISDFYFEFAPPVLLSDSARLAHHVDPVHAGSGGLPTGYTGKGIVLGYVDTGIDWLHPDFWNPDSTTRVYRYWDQSVFTGTPPLPYGYGSVWDSASIDDGTIGSIDNNVHGSTVAGAGSGNAFANGSNLGMAPESIIVVVESDFSAPNWTLTVADACDYIFSIADSLGVPAVINLSLGSYLGSHDGDDPASTAIENLLDEKPGRIVVAAAGNSGLQGAYHQHSNVTTDTNFVWFKNNPAGSLGANTIFFDLWSDVSEATFNFGFAADKPAPDYELRGTTNFYGATSSLGAVIYDTIWSGSNRLATIEVYTSIISGAYNMQVLFTSVDTTNYLYRFRTTGTGSYDLWSGAWLGLSDMETLLPTTVEMPDIAFYTLPDTMQTIVSSWNCSEKVVSVGNVQNMYDYVDGNFNTYTEPLGTIPGDLCPKSSKGPSRHGLNKPDISASGQMTFGPALFWMQTIPAYYPQLDTGLWHYRNSGTSMSSPVVAGIAALYLEKCHKSDYQDFINDATTTAFTDMYTGAVPNNAYGYGKIHALDLLLSTNFAVTVNGPSGICDSPVSLGISSTSTVDSVIWSNGSNVFPTIVDSSGTYSAVVFNDKGCKVKSDTLTLNQFPIPTISSISQVGDTLSVTASDSYQWTLNGTDMGGETNPSLTVSAPFGTYTCYTVNSDGCMAYADSVVLTVGLDDLDIIAEHIQIYPNPVNDVLSITSDLKIQEVFLVNINGQKVQIHAENGFSYDLSELAKGTYTVVIQTVDGIYQSKITRI